MTYTITKNLTEINKGKKGDNDPEWIIIHFVGAAGQAEGNSDYFKEVYRGASAQYFVDPKSIYQVVEDDTPAWHIGDGQRSKKGTHNGYVKNGFATNTNSIGIELCQDTSTGKDVWHWGFHPETLKRAEWLVRQLQKKHNIDDAHVIRHYDATTKNCPGNWDEQDWKNFKAKLKKDVAQPKPSAKPKDEGKHKDEGGMHLVEAGETLYSIAKAHGVTVANLVAWNKLKDANLIIPESKLYVKKPAEAKPAPKPAAKPAPKPAAKPKKSIDQLAQEVIDGKHGSGDARKKSLGSNFDAVQKRVNEIMNGKKKPQKSLDQLVKEVLAGKHGSGRERMISLGSRYDEVQREVNRRAR